MKHLLIIIASLMAVAGNIPYLLDVVNKRVIPHAYTWMVWSVVSGIVLSGLIIKGAGLGAIPSAASEIFTFIIFIFSLKYGFSHVQPVDRIFLVLALAGIVPWLITSDPTISVIVAVSIDVIAFVPTLRKTYAHPDTETKLLYGMNVTRHILTLFTLDNYNIATTLHSITMIITNTLMVLFLLVRHGKKLNSE